MQMIFRFFMLEGRAGQQEAEYAEEQVFHKVKRVTDRGLQAKNFGGGLSGSVLGREEGAFFDVYAVSD